MEGKGLTWWHLPTQLWEEARPCTEAGPNSHAHSQTHPVFGLRLGGQVYISPDKLCQAGNKGREKARTAAPPMDPEAGRGAEGGQGKAETPGSDPGVGRPLRTWGWASGLLEELCPEASPCSTSRSSRSSQANRRKCTANIPQGTAPTRLPLCWRSPGPLLLTPGCCYRVFLQEEEATQPRPSKLPFLC